MQELHRGIRGVGLYTELILRNLCRLCLAEIQFQECGHHLDFRPVVVVHRALHLQASHVLYVVCVIEYLGAQASWFQQAHTDKWTGHYTDAAYITVSIRYPFDGVYTSL